MICVAYPTIMDGLVLRWWSDEDGYRNGLELASASRNCVMLAKGCPEEIQRLADRAHSYLAVEYAAHLHPRLDVSRWTTHEPKRFLSRELEALSHG